MSENKKGGDNTPKPGEQGFQKSKVGKKAPTSSIDKSLKTFKTPKIALDLPFPDKYKFGHPIEDLSYIPIPVLFDKYRPEKMLGFITRKHDIPVGFKYSLGSDKIIYLTEDRHRGATWQCKCGRAHLYIGLGGTYNANTPTGWLLKNRRKYHYRLSEKESGLVDKLHKKNKNAESSKWLNFQDKHICEKILNSIKNEKSGIKTQEHLLCTCGEEYVYTSDYYETFTSLKDIEEDKRKQLIIREAKRAEKLAKKAERFAAYEKAYNEGLIPNISTPATLPVVEVGGITEETSTIFNTKETITEVSAQAETERYRIILEGFEKAEVERKHQKRRREKEEEDEDEYRRRRGDSNHNPGGGARGTF